MTKLVASLLVTIALTLGLLAATVAYAPSIDRDDLVGLTLNAPAGAVVADEAMLTLALASDADAQSEGGPFDTSDPYVGLVLERLTALGDGLEGVTVDGSIALTAGLQPIALYAGGETITPEMVASLRRNADELAAATPTKVPVKAPRVVRVREFSLPRWSMAWLCGLASVVLLGGSMMIRTASKRALAAATAGDDTQPHEGPEAALRILREELNELHRRVMAMSNPSDQVHTIVHRLDELHQEHVTQFLEGRDRIQARLGVGGFAQLMDKFAGAERMMFRSWSAAADQVVEEAVECLAEAAHRMQDAVDRTSA